TLFRFFGARFGLVVVRTMGAGGAAPAVVGAVVVGGAVALLEGRSRVVRRFLGYLALGNLAFLALFLFGSPTSELLLGGAEAEAGSDEAIVPHIDGPVVLVVFDELPLTTILRPDGTINETRYPAFARLARESTWFRDTVTVSPNTHLAVPALLTGTRPEPGDIPTHEDHPRNYFTLFGGSYPVSAYEPVTDLCPTDICGSRPGGSLRQALEDAVLAYAHRVLPDRLRRDLPPVDQSWGNFRDALGEPATPPADGGSGDTLERPTAGNPFARGQNLPEDDAGPAGQAGALRRTAAPTGREPSGHLHH